jgi:cell filamentation protein
MSAAKYKTDTGIEGSYQIGSRYRVLKNKLGIIRKSEMDEIEVRALSSIQRRYLDEVTEHTVFSAKFLCQMHRDWLSDIYEWAGNYRTVEMSKGNFSWPPAYRVAANMEQFEINILRKLTPFRSESIDSAVQNLAIVHAELLLIHPFREGNGRLSRWLTDLMCLQAGLPEPDYGFVGKGSKQRQAQYLQGVIKGYSQDYRLLADFFREALERSTIS